MDHFRGQLCKIPLIRFLLLIATVISSVRCQLTVDFYNQTCPNVVSIVSSTMNSLSTNDNVVAPSVIRLFNHDCFVQGCDASIMITSTGSNLAERDATDNSNLPGNAFNAITAAKQAVEAVCPGVVSCADIIALAARDSVVFLGGPSWQVPLGRRDGLVSQASLVKQHLPSSNADVSQLTSLFSSMGLTTQDLVALSGAHTIGFSDCNEITSRLYNFNNTRKRDPNMDPSYAQQLQTKCSPDGSGQVQPLDQSSSFVFDNNYYKNLQARRGLLFSDQSLFNDALTRDTVNAFANSQLLFFQEFVNSMVKMSLVGIKNGSAGEIRKDCTAFNQG